MKLDELRARFRNVKGLRITQHRAKDINELHAIIENAFAHIERLEKERRNEVASNLSFQNTVYKLETEKQHLTAIVEKVKEIDWSYILGLISTETDAEGFRFGTIIKRKEERLIPELQQLIAEWEKEAR